MPTSVGACDRGPICNRVRSKGRERFCSFDGSGLAENNPILLNLDRTDAYVRISSNIRHFASWDGIGGQPPQAFEHRFKGPTDCRRKRVTLDASPKPR